MSWLDKQVSLYTCLADNIGTPATLRDILYTRYAVNHEWYFKIYKPVEKWISGNFNDLSTIHDLRTREMTHEEKGMLKQTLQCFALALLMTKKKGFVQEISRTGLIQLDFDYKDIKSYDLRELMQAVFALPFVAFCGLSCSGTGFYALVAIAEPDKMKEYAEHCFEILTKWGIPPDTTKGRNVNDLRFVSYDDNMLIREQPRPLKIKRFNTPKPQAKVTPYRKTFASNTPLKWAVEAIKNAQEGNRFDTVRKYSILMGGYGYGLHEIKQTINECSQFAGVESKYLNHATEGFEYGKLKPII